MSDESAAELEGAFSRLQRSLGPFVAGAIEDAERNGRLVAGDARRAAGPASDAALPLEELPLQELLRIMFLTWSAAFGTSLSTKHRSAVSGLRGTLDRLAAGQTLAPTDASRARERADLLIGATAAEDAPPSDSATGVAPPSPPPPSPPRKDPETTPATPPEPAQAPPVSAEGGPSSRAEAHEPTVVAATPGPATPATSGTKTRSRLAAPSEDRPARIVCWMKPDEARVVLSAYISESSQEVTTEKGLIIAAEWNAPDSDEAKKYRAEVCMVRYGRSKDRGTPKRLWIRREEVEAVLEAYRGRTSVAFEHRTHGSGGCAQYHPDDAEETQRYFANVMLKRYR